jgi:archaellum component FlaC
MLSEKEQLERELSTIQLVEIDEKKEIERMYSVRERISTIEESINRLKNEYEGMKAQLDQVNADIGIYDSKQSDNMSFDERARLENEKMLLNERIDRRRALLEQAHLL